jgi:hypothetical protein
VREEGQAGRSGLQVLRALPTAGLLHAGGVYLAEASITAEDPEPLSPLQRVEPLYGGTPSR